METGEGGSWGLEEDREQIGMDVLRVRGLLVGLWGPAACLGTCTAHGDMGTGPEHSPEG